MLYFLFNQCFTDFHFQPNMLVTFVSKNIFLFIVLSKYHVDINDQGPLCSRLQFIIVQEHHILSDVRNVHACREFFKVLTQGDAY